jgi:putative ABC transport system permease protein
MRFESGGIMLSRALGLFRNLFRKDAVERALDDELRFSVEILTEEKMRAGLSPSEARRRALIELGGVDQVKEEVRSVRVGRWLEDLSKDVRFGLRLLLRNPGFTVVAVITLALGIGANTAVFSVVNAVVIRPLHYPDSDRLMAILSTSQNNKSGFTSAPGVFLDWRDRSTSFEVVAGARSTTMTWSGKGQAQRLSIAMTSFDFFSLLEVQPVQGRLFSKDEDQLGHEAVALLNGGFWQREFGGDEKVLGKSIILNGAPFQVIGVLPPDIRFAHFGRADVWLPLAANRAFRTGGDVVVVGRLRRGVTQQAAQAEMETVMRGIGRDHKEDSRTGVLVEPLHNWVVGDTRLVFLTILGAVAFLLLICCANIANLLMTRSTVRQREMAIRASLGASRLRLVRQTLVESVLLSSIGGILGLGLAAALIRAVPSIHAFQIPRIEEIAMDHTVLIIAAILSLATGILFGLAPALQVRNRDLTTVLRAQGPSRPGGWQLRNALVVVQLALALVLLSGAGLMVNSLVRLLHIDLGYERSNVVTIDTTFNSRKYDHGRIMEFQRQLAAEVSRMPGVEAVSASDYLPLMAVLFPMNLRVAGTDILPKCKALARHIDPNYLRVMGIPLLRGRDLGPTDDTRKPVPVLISKNTARALFDTGDPIGKHLLSQYRELNPLEVVGVVGDVRQIGLTKDPSPQVYIPLAQGRSTGYVVARTAPHAGDLSAAIRAAVRAIDPEVPAPEIGTLDEWFDREIAKPRFYLALLGAFAALGVILAAVGIYGIIAYGVALRTQEFGIRMALGAERKHILQLVLGGGLRLICIGAALGLAASLALTRLLTTMLYEVRPNDPLTFGCVFALLTGTALLACYIAARRAVGVDPNVALRCE